MIYVCVDRDSDRDIRPMSCSDSAMSKMANFTLTGKTLGKGSFAKVEEAVHEVLKVKVGSRPIFFLKNFHTF